MNWGRKKNSAPSSSRSSIITRVFPVSWFSKLKQKGGNPRSNSWKRSEVDFPIQNPSYIMDDDDDAYRTISFREGKIEGRRSTCGVNPVCYDSDDEFQVPVSSFKSFDLGEMEMHRRGKCQSFDDMVLDIQKMKEKQHKEKSVREDDEFKGKRPNAEAQFTTPRKSDAKDLSSRKVSRRDVREKETEKQIKPDDGEEKFSKLVERDVFPIDEDCAFEASNVEGTDPISEWKNFEEKKLKEIKVKTESSAYISRESDSRKMQQKNRVKRAYSPRTECRIRVLEDMKRTRMKLKKKKETEVQTVESRTVFDSFAVVKSSFNPEQDFRDSMVEMISQKGIYRPEELEELLACYLTLNCDEYHDIIIKVFQQVWFELNRCVYGS
ncbi:hypothetical protein BUALT_Bualt03G0038300 [Buddleja alternifolia]|uniref:Transcription repressor n=1 Tax=Buddleja alternifolia TaxID=168488 RepID=A0AAV6XXP0_9LAMI|nr:hypothetical protein BUALT_Bualt03G0038300 [Buddleja alternifolia]